MKKNIGKLSLVSSVVASIIFAGGFGFSGAAMAEKKAPTNAKDFAKHMAKKHGFTQDYIRSTLSKAEKRQSILDAMSRPAEGKDWHEYRPIFLTKKRIDGGVEFWNKHQELLEAAEKKYQVPAEIIVAIIGVETYYGKRQGSYPVLDAISTLAFHYPKRAKFFASELEQYFLLSREQAWDLTKNKGSYAGAMGMGQFIPSSYRHYAVDFDGDGSINLFNSHADAIGSVANYFNKHRWKFGQPVVEFLPKVNKSVALDFKNTKLKPQFTVAMIEKAGIGLSQGKPEDIAGLYYFKQKNGNDIWAGYHNFYVITRYNRSPLYAMAVHQLSQEIKKAKSSEKSSRAVKTKK